MAGVNQAYSVSAAYTGAQTNTLLVAAPAAGRAIVVQWVCVSAGTTGGEWQLLDGSGGTIKLDGFLATNSSVFIPCNRVPIVLTAATGLYITTITATPTRFNVGYSVENV